MSVNLADTPATDLKYNFYSIDNPKEYLGGGSDAIVVEQGPYNLRCVQEFALCVPVNSFNYHHVLTMQRSFFSIIHS